MPRKNRNKKTSQDINQRQQNYSSRFNRSRGKEVVFNGTRYRVNRIGSRVKYVSASGESFTRDIRDIERDSRGRITGWFGAEEGQDKGQNPKARTKETKELKKNIDEALDRLERKEDDSNPNKQEQEDLKTLINEGLSLFEQALNNEETVTTPKSTVYEVQPPTQSTKLKELVLSRINDRGKQINGLKISDILSTRVEQIPSLDSTQRKFLLDQSLYDPNLRKRVQGKEVFFNNQKSEYENLTQETLDIVSRAVADNQFSPENIRGKGWQSRVSLKDVLDNLSPSEIDAILREKSNKRVRVGNKITTVENVKEFFKRAEQSYQTLVKRIEEQSIKNFYTEQQKRITNGEELLDRKDLEYFLGNHKFGGLKNNDVETRTLRQIETDVSSNQKYNFKDRQFITLYSELSRSKLIEKDGNTSATDPDDLAKLYQEKDEEITKKLEKDVFNKQEITLGQYSEEVRIDFGSLGNYRLSKVLGGLSSEAPIDSKYDNKLEEALDNITESHEFVLGGNKVSISGYTLDQKLQEQNGNDLFNFVNGFIKDKELSEAFTDSLINSGFDFNQLTQNEASILKLQIEKAVVNKVKNLNDNLIINKSLAQVVLEESYRKDVEVDNLLRVVSARSRKEYASLAFDKKVGALKEVIKLDKYLELSDPDYAITSFDTDNIVYQSFLQEFILGSGDKISLAEIIQFSNRRYFRVEDFYSEGAISPSKLGGQEQKDFGNVSNSFRVFTREKESDDYERVRQSSGRFPENTRVSNDFGSYLPERSSEIISRYQQFNKSFADTDFISSIKEEVALRYYFEQVGKPQPNTYNLKDLRSEFEGLKVDKQKWSLAKQLSGMETLEFPPGLSYDQKIKLSEEEARVRERVNTKFRESAKQLTPQEKESMATSDQPFYSSDKQGQIRGFVDNYYRELAIQEILSSDNSITRSDINLALKSPRDKKSKVIVDKINAIKLKLSAKDGVTDDLGSINKDKATDLYMREFEDIFQKVVQSGGVYTKKIYASDKSFQEERIHYGLPAIFDGTVLADLEPEELAYLHNIFLQSRLGENKNKTNYKSRFSVLGLLRSGLSEGQIRVISRNKKSLNSEIHHMEQFLAADLTGKGETSGSAVINNEGKFDANKATIKHDDLPWVEGKINLSNLDKETEKSLERFTFSELQEMGKELGINLSAEDKGGAIKRLLKSKGGHKTASTTVIQRIEDLQKDVDAKTGELLYDFIMANNPQSAIARQIAGEDKSDFIKKYKDNENNIRVMINGDESLVKSFVKNQAEELFNLNKPLKEEIDRSIELSVPRQSVYSKNDYSHYDRKSGTYQNYSLTGITMGQRVKIDKDGNVKTDLDDSLLLAYDMHSKVPDSLKNQVDILNPFKEAQKRKPPEERLIDPSFSPVSDKIPYTKQYFNAPYSIHQDNFYHALHFMSESTANSLEDNFEKVEKLYTRLKYEIKESVETKIRSSKSVNSLAQDLDQEQPNLDQTRFQQELEKKIQEKIKSKTENLIKALDGKFNIKEGQISLTGFTQFGVGSEERSTHESKNNANQNRYQPYLQLKEIESEIESRGVPREEFFEVSRLLGSYKITSSNHVNQFRQYAKEKAINDPALRRVNNSKRISGFGDFELENDLRKELSLFDSSITFDKKGGSPLNLYANKVFGVNQSQVRKKLATELSKATNSNINPKDVSDESVIDYLLEAESKGVTGLSNFNYQGKSQVDKQELRDRYRNQKWGGKKLKGKNSVIELYKNLTENDKYEKRNQQIKDLRENTNLTAAKLDSFIRDQVESNSKLSQESKNLLKSLLNTNSRSLNLAPELAQLTPFSTPDDIIKSLAEYHHRKGKSFNVPGTSDREVIELIREFQ